jgi:hypothetical protein
MKYLAYPSAVVVALSRMLARLVMLGAALGLAGCVTAENPLTQNDIANMKLTGVTVSFSPSAAIWWEEGERAYAGQKAMSDAQVADARRTPEYRAYVGSLLAPKIKEGVEQAMAGQLIGARPVRLDIVVKDFTVPSAAFRILIGGNPQMSAAATLVDARTGAVIISNPDLQVSVLGPGGLVGVAMQAAIDNARHETTEGKLAANYGQAYRQWLTHGA